MVRWPRISKQVCLAKQNKCTVLCPVNITLQALAEKDQNYFRKGFGETSSAPS